MDTYSWNWVGSWNSDVWALLNLERNKWTQQEVNALKTFVQTKCKNAASLGWTDGTTKTFNYPRPGSTSGETVAVKVRANSVDQTGGGGDKQWTFNAQSVKEE